MEITATNKAFNLSADAHTADEEKRERERSKVSP